jgi:hypothetical protein
MKSDHLFGIKLQHGLDEIVRIFRDRRALDQRSGIVHQDVDTAETIDGPGHDGRRRFRLRDIGLN